MAEKSLPRYWASEMPEGLATEHQLAKIRHRLASRQEPVGMLVYGRSELISPVYKISDAVPLPPLTSAQREAARRRRTTNTCCKVCGHDTGHPLGGGNHTPDVCDACRDDNQWQRLRENRPADRQKASEWAANVLADPTAYLVAVDLVDVRQPVEMSIVKRHAVARVGYVSAQGGEPTWFNAMPTEKPKRLRDLPPGVLPGTGLTAPAGKDGERYRGVPFTEIAQRVSDDLYGKRLVAWGEWGVSTLMDDLRYAICGYGYRKAGNHDWAYLGPRHRTVAIGDQLLKQYSGWVGQLRRRGEPTVNGSWWGYAAQKRPDLPPGDRVMWMLERIEAMAASPQRGDYP